MRISYKILVGCLIASTMSASGFASYLSEITEKVNAAHLKKASICSSADNLLCNIRAQYQPLYTGDHLREYQAQIKLYTRTPVILENMLLNAQPYLYYVYHETQKYHLPAQLVFVPAAETNYEPFGVSSTGAAGLWQFMPATAQDFGMSIRSGYDARRDVIRSTDAGLKNLKYLHNRFHSWPLAFAAYNCGEGRVDQAIHRNRSMGLPTDFWHLSLPKETRGYVRNILAISAIMTKPSAFSIKLPTLPNHPYFSSVKIKQEIAPSTVGFVSGVKLSQMKALNPAISNWQNTLNTDYTLLIPQEKKSDVISRLASMGAIASA